ncbi:hypothetical protein CYMTET_27008 [Cymbomonas tetramitiformis]|uniref:Uncharacterized protein n=1 Tax=Cymbomonas tetramitiformis TaxID=36881 RepID=A0AAE0KXC6_9CHLO|nr:hypothetical protein CYMTET_27008 [Cymbomonas tetramitiformis]
MRWLAPLSPNDDGSDNESVDSGDLADEPDREEFVEHDVATPEQNTLPGARTRAPQTETPEDRRTRLESEKYQKQTAEDIGAQFTENRRSTATGVPFKSKAGKQWYTQPPDDFTPGVLKSLVRDKPSKVEDGMWYVFQRILPPKTYWDKMSENTIKYATKHKDGEDINSAKAEDRRHSAFQGKGKQRPWKVNISGPQLYSEA